MKLLISFLLLFVLTTQKNNNPDLLIGTWQINSDIVGSGLMDSYCFYPNSKFTYLLGSDEMRTIISFSGIYKIDSARIYFRILNETIIKDPVIQKGSPGFQGGWVLNGTDIITIPSNDSSEQVASFFMQTNQSPETIMISHDTYYKVSDDPNFGFN